MYMHENNDAVPYLAPAYNTMTTSDYYFDTLAPYLTIANSAGGYTRRTVYTNKVRECPGGSWGCRQEAISATGSIWATRTAVGIAGSEPTSPPHPKALKTPRSTMLVPALLSKVGRSRIQAALSCSWTLLLIGFTSRWTSPSPKIRMATESPTAWEVILSITRGLRCIIMAPTSRYWMAMSKGFRSTNCGKSTSGPEMWCTRFGICIHPDLNDLEAQIGSIGVLRAK